MLWIIVSDRTVDSCGCGQWYTGRAGGQQLPGGRELPWRQVRLHSTAAACPVPCHTTQGALYNTQHAALSAAQHCTPVAHWLIFCTLHTMGSPNRDNSQPFWLKVFSEKGSRGPEMQHKTHFCTIGFSWEINSTQLLQSCKVQAKTFLLSNTTTIQWHDHDNISSVPPHICHFYDLMISVQHWTMGMIFNLTLSDESKYPKFEGNVLSHHTMVLVSHLAKKVFSCKDSWQYLMFLLLIILHK